MRRGLRVLALAVLAVTLGAPAVAQFSDPPADPGNALRVYQQLLREARNQGLDTTAAERLGEQSRSAAQRRDQPTAERLLTDAIARLRALLADAPSGPTPASGPPAPVYLVAFTHHYSGPGGYYATAAEVRHMGEFFARHQLPGTLFFDGILVSRLQQEDPGLIAQINAWGLPLGYHGEETHGPYPVGSDLCAEVYPLKEAQDYRGQWSLTTGQDWASGVKLVEDRYSHALPYRIDPRDGRIERREPAASLPAVGGLKLVQQAFGRDVWMMPSHGLESAPEGYAFRRMSQFVLDQPAIPIAAHALRIFGISELQGRVMAIAGPQHSIFWYMGRLHSKGDESGECGWQPQAVRRHLADLDRSQPRLVLMGFSSFDDAVADQTVRYVNDEFLPRNPGSAWVSGESLLAKLEPEKGHQLTAAELGEVGKALLGGWRQRPPDLVAAGGRYYSLTDAFEGLARALALPAGAGQPPASVSLGPLYGPVLESGDALLTRETTVAVTDVVAAATAVAADLDRARGDRFVPARVTIGRAELNAAEALYAFAAAWQQVAAGTAAPVTVPPSGAFPPYADVLQQVYHPRSRQPLCYTNGQLWTIKPVRVAASAVATAPVATDQPRPVATPARPVRVVFASNLQGQGRCYREDPLGADLYTVTYDLATRRAAELQRLTATANQAEWFPTISPDGRWVAYNVSSAGRPARQGVRLIDLRTGRDQELLADSRFPYLGADGKQLAWSTQTRDGAVLRVAPFGVGEGRLDLSRAQVVADRRYGADRVEDPALSPDGRWVAFHRKEDQRTPAQLAVINTDGTGFQPITPANGAGHCTISPDGTVAWSTSSQGRIGLVRRVGETWPAPSFLPLSNEPADYAAFDDRFRSVAQVRHSYLEWVTSDLLLVTSHGSDRQGAFSFARLCLVQLGDAGPQLHDLSGAIEALAGTRGKDFCTADGVMER